MRRALPPHPVQEVLHLSSTVQGMQWPVRQVPQSEILPFFTAYIVTDKTSQGCGSSAPKTLNSRDVTTITTLKDAQRFCKSYESVCGIPGREGTNAFECIDPSVALESCKSSLTPRIYSHFADEGISGGGCVTPHPFHPPTAPTGVDCGRLPSAIAASCADSRCVVTRCRLGWRPDANQSACVEIAKQGVAIEHPKALARMGKERRAEVVLVDAVLSAKIRHLVDRVLDLAAIATIGPVLTSFPTSSSPLVDHLILVSAIVEATQNVLSSKSVVSLVGNINVLATMGGLAVNTLHACGCTDALGLHAVVASLNNVLKATVDIVQWCHQHPVGALFPPPGSSTIPDILDQPILNTSDALINIGLGASLQDLVDLLIVARVSLKHSA